MIRRPDHLFLCGFSGSGKTETGRYLAQMLGWTFLDTDETVEKRTGKTISTIFAEEGEGHFRMIEFEVIQDAVNQAPAVIALGGGALVAAQNRRLIQGKGMMIFLQACPEMLYERLKKGPARPLLGSYNENMDSANMIGRINLLLKTRSQQYMESDLTVATDGKTPYQVAREIAERLGCA